MSNNLLLNELIENTKNHPLWHEFKHINFDLDCGIIFPEGAGGNFIASLLINDDSGKIADKNEYKSADMFALDTYGYKEAIPHININNLYALLSPVLAEAQKNMHRHILLGHNVPFITDKIFTVNCEEMVIVTVNEESCQVPFWLERVKNLFDADYDNKKYNIYNLLNFIKNLVATNKNFVPYVSLQDNHVLETLLKSLPKKVVDSNSLMAWYYLLEAKSQAWPISLDTFQEFASEILMNMDSFKDQYISAYTPEKISHLTQNWKKITIVDYIDLFFRIELPKDSELSNIDRNKLVEYSLKNINLVADMSLLLPERQKLQVQNTVNGLRDLLVKQT